LNKFDANPETAAARAQFSNIAGPLACGVPISRAASGISGAPAVD
jgi:hypothetical protein